MLQRCFSFSSLVFIHGGLIINVHYPFLQPVMDPMKCIVNKTHCISASLPWRWFADPTCEKQPPERLIHQINKPLSWEPQGVSWLCPPPHQYLLRVLYFLTHGPLPADFACRLSPWIEYTSLSDTNVLVIIYISTCAASKNLFTHKVLYSLFYPIYVSPFCEELSVALLSSPETFLNNQEVAFFYCVIKSPGLTIEFWFQLYP